jgi:hypothetical protein
MILPPDPRGRTFVDQKTDGIDSYLFLKAFVDLHMR